MFLLFFKILVCCIPDWVLIYNIECPSLFHSCSVIYDIKVYVACDQKCPLEMCYDVHVYIDVFVLFLLKLMVNNCRNGAM